MSKGSSLLGGAVAGPAGMLTGMVGGKAQPPAPTDYGGAINSQFAANLAAANDVSTINRPNETNPYGTKTWQNLGNNQWSVNTQMSPEQQDLFNKYLATQGVMGDAATKVAGQVSDVLSKPIDLSGLPDNTKAATDAIYNRYAQYLDPRYAKAEDQTRTDLVNRGFSLGTEGYDRQMEGFNDTKQKSYSDAMDAAITGGSKTAIDERNQAISEILMQRAQPMTELNSLLQGSAPTVPNFQPNYTGATAAPAPVLAGTQMGADYGMDIYNANVGTQNAMLSGLFGLGASAVRGAAR